MATSPSVREDLVPPWTLTASDGSGLVLARVDAKAVVDGPLAFTELHLYFRNDESRIREGTFQITLPAHAAVSRFAMESSGQWMEAEVVPKLVARRAYDDFLHRKQDPALLEKAAGNQFTAKVFPIAARSEKHLVISYSQELPGSRYTLPLHGLPKTERLDVELAFTGGEPAQRLAERNWQPDRDFVAARPATAAAVSAGTLVAAQIELAANADRDVPRGITLLVDTSASRALGFDAYVASIRKLVGELRASWGDALPLQVVAFDQDSELVFDGRVAECGEPVVHKLVERGAAGASDLGQALAWISSRGMQSRVVVVGDGVITAGVEGRELQAAIKQLGSKVERLDFVLAGGLRDERVAALAVHAGLARTGAVLDLATDPVAVALGESVATDVPIAIPGAAWVYPRTIASARAGTKVMVFARLPKPSSSIEVVAGGQRRTVRVLAGSAPLVERAVAGAELAELEAKLPATKGNDATALRAAIATKSVAARVLSNETSMLVLESDADYARYGIERKALIDVLVVRASGVERLHRGAIAPIPTRTSTTPPLTADSTEPSRPGEPPQPRTIQQEPARVPTPTGDTDHDGILDQEDRCPSQPETFNGSDDSDGCPDRGRVVVSSTSIVILQDVNFETDRAVIKRESYPILDAVAAVLLGNPDIAELEIQGHTDERGDDAYNLELSDRRASSVRQYLIAKGVAAQRLSSLGYGETQPIDRAHTGSAWAKNRRVAFLILRRSDGSGTTTQPSARTPAPPPPPPPAVTGELAAIEHALAVHDVDGALVKARDWHAHEPGNVLALIGLGESLEARHADATAARIYGSIIDLFPGRADMRRFAGERLSRLANAKDLAVDTYRRAVADRPDHMTGHRLLAYALVRADKPADAFTAIIAGLDQKYGEGRFAGGVHVLGEDAAMIGAAYAAAVPAKQSQIVNVLARHRLAVATQPSTRFILYWETDANDVDFHIKDARGGHAFYSQPKLTSGGELYADVTTGYGPECFAIAGAPAAGPYQLSLEYYSQGPMGYGMGLLEIQTFDPKRGFRFEDRPYVIMTNRAKLELGTYL
jgi:outer membrane protein OmpA-like peptidoglycan-associated protein